MGEGRGELSVEMRRFISLELARPFVYRFLGILIIYYLLFAGLLYVLFSSVKLFYQLSLGSTILAAIGIIFIGGFGGFFIYLKSPLLRVP